MFDFLTSDRFYKTLEPPTPPVNSDASEIEQLKAAIAELKAELSKQPESVPEPEPTPEPEPELPFVAEKEPETAPMTVSGDELKYWLKKASSGDRSLGEYFRDNKDAIAEQLKSYMEVN